MPPILSDAPARGTSPPAHLLPSPPRAWRTSQESDLTTIQANGIEIAYDEFGEKNAAPLLLVMGLGAQMIAWEADFCGQLAGRGYRVIRFDNRDVGLSTKFDEACPEPAPLVAKALQGEAVTPPYSLQDMADDAVGLLDELGIDAAHIVGASMGGMIVQRMAIHHPDRVRTMTLIMSNTGNPDLPPGNPETMAALTQPIPDDPEAAIEQGVRTWKLLHGPGFPFDEERTRAMVRASRERSLHPTGQPRQLLAIMADGDRRPALAKLTAPTLVIHGDADPLVPIAGGQDTAAAIPGATLITIAGMGHELPSGAWPQICDVIDAHIKAAG